MASSTFRRETRAGAQLARALRAAARLLEQHVGEVNALNVLLAADRDTGSNILATMHAALRQVEKLQPTTAHEVARAAAHGALTGARGNSGMLVAQFLGGLATSLEDRRTFGGNAVATVLTKAANTVWQGVMKPVDGTMLTVCADAARAATIAAEAGEELLYVLEAAVRAAHGSVERTSFLRPALREAGVVDAGGRGFALLLEGVYRFFDRERRLGAMLTGRVSTQSDGRSGPARDTESAQSARAGDNGFELPEISVVAVVSGAGLEAVFRHNGVAAIVSGGQTMNPSAAELLDAIDAVGSREVVVLPNNRNVILAANQAAELAGKRVAVVPTASVAQGLAALDGFQAQCDLANNLSSMSAAAATVHTVEITRAVRAAVLGDLEIRAGESIALLDDRLVGKGDNAEEAACAALRLLSQQHGVALTIYYGQDASEERAHRLAARIGTQGVEEPVAVVAGQQPHYEYIIAIHSR